MERATVTVEGVVQSVGFRPFVYRTAVACELAGTVRNLGDAGVRIEIEGAGDAIDSFLETLTADPPPLAVVERLSVDREAVTTPRYDAFEILASTDAADAGSGTIPPDTAICDACVADMRDPDSRFFEYWATACVDCGPRFTVVESLPYDRPATSMAPFPLCDDCRGDYEDPADRRYHAQAIACPACGPTLTYGEPGEDRRTGEAVGNGRDPVPTGLAADTTGRAAVEATAAVIAGGGIAVIKGVGGAHLACDATDEAAVDRLRADTGRPGKPFAVMAADVGAVDGLADVSAGEAETLASYRRPIALLDERPDSALAGNVAPGLHTVGVMLPYTGVHHLVFDHLDSPIVCTSANHPGQPMLVENDRIVDELADVADGFLLHDRRIVARCDDSVVRHVDGFRRLLRRSRGFAPTPVPLPNDAGGTILALGPELDVTPGILAGDSCFLTQHVGDVDDVATAAYHRTAIAHLHSIAGLGNPTVVAHDAHPEFTTTREARRLVDESDIDRVAVQHHHAHAASVLAEHDRRAAIAITVDGVGYGPDRTVWGGEVLDARRASFERVAGLAPMAMPGGDRATRYPGRMLAGVLFSHPGVDGERVRELLDRHDVPFPCPDEQDLVVQQLESGVNTPQTTSAGRLLDAVSALVGACGERTYEGEPAMRLEALARRGRAVDSACPRRTVDGRPTLDGPALVVWLAEQLATGTAPADVAATAQERLAEGLADLAVTAAERRNRDAIALSGGVAYNEHIAGRIGDLVDDAGFDLLSNDRVPPGDGGIAYGQAAVAAARSEQT